MPKHFEVETRYKDETKSIAFVRLDGEGRKSINNRSSTRYEIISGVGQFCLRYNESQSRHIIPVQAGSVVTVNAGVEYQDRGDLVMLATCEPPFKPDSVWEIR